MRGSIVKFAIADDHPMIIEMYTKIVEENKNHKVIIAVNNGVDLLKNIEMKIPDIVLLDIRMPDMNGITCMGILRERYPKIKVVILTMFKEKSFISKLKTLGAASYLIKSSLNSKNFMEAVEGVLRGEQYFPNLDDSGDWW